MAPQPRNHAMCCAWLRLKEGSAVHKALVWAIIQVCILCLQSPRHCWALPSCLCTDNFSFLDNRLWKAACQAGRPDSTSKAGRFVYQSLREPGSGFSGKSARRSPLLLRKPAAVPRMEGELCVRRASYVEYQGRPEWHPIGDAATV